MMAGVREAISQRCQLDMGAVLAVAHSALATAAYVQESNSRTLPAPGHGPGIGPGIAPGAGGGGPRGGGHTSGQTWSGPAGAQIANALGPSHSRAGSGAHSRVQTVNSHHPSTGGGKALAGGGTGGSGAAGVGGYTSNSTSGRPGRGAVGRDGGLAVRMSSALLSGDFGLMTEDEDCGVQQSVQAHVASLAHTLLLACMGAAAQGDAAAHADTCLPYGTGAAAMAGGADNGSSVAGSLPERRKAQCAVSPLAALHPLAAMGSGQGMGAAAAAVAAAGAYGVTADGCVVHNCNSHMQVCQVAQAWVGFRSHGASTALIPLTSSSWVPHAAAIHGCWCCC